MIRKGYYLSPFNKKYEMSTAKTFFMLFLSFTLIFLLGIRLYQLQIRNQSLYVELSRNNHNRFVSIECPRGTIFDRHGEKLAIDIPTYHLYANIYQTLNMISTTDSKEEKVKNISSILTKTIRLTEKEIKELITKNIENQDEFLIKSNLEKDEYAAFNEKSFKLPGFFVKEGFKRYYPNGSMLAHMIGYTRPISIEQKKLPEYKNYEDSERIGKAGIELFYESILHGKKGQKIQTINAVGNIIEENQTSDIVKGENIYLTIDAKMQKFVEETMKDLVGTIIVLNVNNGEIIATANNPTFDPNIFSEPLPDELWNDLQNKRAFYNIAIQGQYPPGSTFKPIISLYALENTIITSKDKIFCGGSLKVPNLSEKYRCWVYPSMHGLLNLKEALKLSCDVFFYELGRKCNIDDLLTFVRRFGISTKTGLDISTNEEMNGFLGNPTWKKKHEGYQWFEGDTMNLSIGQGFIDVTPMQMAKVYAILGNSGKMIIPHLLLKTSTNQEFIDFLTPLQKKYLATDLMLKQENINIIQEDLHSVTEPGGTASGLLNDSISVAAKTGTAEGAPGKYGKSKQHLWLTTFAPTEKPQIAVIMLLEDSDLEFGGNLAPFVKKVILKYFEITQNSGGFNAN